MPDVRLIGRIGRAHLPHFAAFARRTVTELESLDGDAKRPDDSTTAVWAQGGDT